MREFFTIAIFKIKADIRMNKTALNSQKEKHSMLSLRRATFVGLAAHRLRNISIHALLAESDADNGDAGNGCDAISIHALLAESDSLNLPSKPIDKNISIHALLAESDFGKINTRGSKKVFLSTLSLRRATPNKSRIRNRNRDFYPRSPCGERHQSQGLQKAYSNFYPRSPCGERPSSWSATATSQHFYPRSPCGERQHFRRSLPSVARFLSTLSLRRATG